MVRRAVEQVGPIQGRWWWLWTKQRGECFAPGVNATPTPRVFFHARIIYISVTDSANAGDARSTPMPIIQVFSCTLFCSFLVCHTIFFCKQPYTSTPPLLTYFFGQAPHPTCDSSLQLHCAAVEPRRLGRTHLVDDARMGPLIPPLPIHLHAGHRVLSCSRSS